MTRPAALVISPESPYPMHGGGAIRTASLLEYLSARYDVDLILFRQDGDSDPALSVPAGLVRDVSTITLPFHSRDPWSWAVRNGRRWIQSSPPLLERFSKQGAEIAGIVRGRRYDAGLIEHFWCAPYVEQVSAVCERTILDLHNIESQLHRSCAKSVAWPFSAAHLRFCQAYIEQERRWLPQFSRLLTTSNDDLRKVTDLAPGTPVSVYRNALRSVPIPESAGSRRSGVPTLGFSANFEYHPNIAGVRFLMRRIWPLLVSRIPQLKLRLIGKKPEVVSRYIKGVQGVETTGPVEDAVTELAKVDVVLAPLLSGSGTRFKILEAWAAARPVVATSIAAEGLDTQTGVNIVLSNTPKSFAESVLELLGSEQQRYRIGCAGRHTFEERFTWNAAWETLTNEVF